MTLPYERTRAVNMTYDFLVRLTHAEETPRVPAAIRREAHALLRHFPTKYEMELASTAENSDHPLFPRVFGRVDQSLD